MNLARLLLWAVALAAGCATAEPVAPNARPPRSEAELRAWLVNMVAYHRFSPEEVRAATGLPLDEVREAIKRLDRRIPPRAKGDPLVVLPYPGGRHPRTGFLDGALDPQRETKLSLFAPWDPASYVVVDVPEAVWANKQLHYLAHTHVPTVWSRQGVALEKLEWTAEADGRLSVERRLPDGVVFAVAATPTPDALLVDMTLFNGSDRLLEDLRVQNCVLTRGLSGFSAATPENTVESGPYIALRSDDGRRWVVAAFTPHHRNWRNPRCPCVHSDPKFADCAPGGRSSIRGRISFFEGADVEAEIRRIEATSWREPRYTLRGEIRDAAGGALLPARVYVQDERGRRHFARSAGGTAVAYRKARGDSVEEHVTLSAHPFEVDLPPGRYEVVVERGKEWHPARERVEVVDADLRRTFTLRRWVDMAARGWYSGDTHVHRPPEELPNLQLAEDLNVAFPLTCWVTRAYASPATGDKSGTAAGGLVRIDPTHVFYPLNTEYEIFTVEGRRHTLGAFFVLNHRTAFEEGVPPVGPAIARARREGALFDLDKHNWPWSMALVPLLENPLYELSNNHVWRTAFGFRDWGEKPGAYMGVEAEAGGLTERGWIDFGLQNYYALLNCGFRLPPTAGTASGVHPVPLGFGRVYVRVPGGFSYDGFVSGLAAGRSFVTTGPMLRTTVNGEDPGHVFHGAGEYRVEGLVESPGPLDRLEIVVDGKVVRRLTPANREEAGSVFASPVDETVRVDGSSWIAVRAFEGRRFAHSGPVHVEVQGKPIRPSKDELDYLIRRVRDEIERSKDLLPAAALDEYRRALAHYEGLRAP